MKLTVSQVLHHIKVSNLHQKAPRELLTITINCMQILLLIFKGSLLSNYHHENQHNKPIVTSIKYKDN